MPISSLPTPPSRTDPTNFAARADAFLLALPTFTAEANALATATNLNETNSLAYKNTAVAAADAAAQSANVSAWVSGTTYTSGVVRYDTTDFKSYRRKTAGAGTTRPGLDSANWQLLSGLGDVDIASDQTITGVKTFSEPIVADITGNAATVTNGATLTEEETFTAPKTFAEKVTISKNSSSVGTAGSAGAFEVGQNTSTAAVLSFYKASYAINMGLDSDNVFRLGGWSQGANAYRFTSDASGNFVSLGNITGTSDERLKKDWSNLNPEFILELSKVKSGIYTRKDTNIVQVGVSAQSLKEVLPEAVLEDGLGYLSVSYGNAALAACIELAKEVVQLRAEIEKLKGSIQ
jgi:hypothetical protein